MPTYNQRENIMNYALIEYLATHENRHREATQARAPYRAERSDSERLSLSDRILRWWLRRSTWRLVRLRT